jgi:RNA polymerase subunit RPABC4/transcription elongation factor Spt4
LISEGPALIEALPGELQNALNGAVPPDEEILIAVRGTPREAFAASKRRVLHLIAPAITGAAPVEIRETAIPEITDVRSESRPVGGRLIWTAGDGEHLIQYPTYDASKYSLVTIRLKQMIGERNSPKPPTQAPALQSAGDQPCPKCATSIPATAAWCPGCGLQVFDPCWECKRALPPNANHCAYCGTPHTEPAVVSCPNCQAVVGPGQGYCPQCGEQARIICAACDRPMRRDWKRCPACGGEPAWEEAGIEPEVAHLRGDEPNDPSAWLSDPPAAAQDAESLNQAGTRAYEAERYQEAIRLFKEATVAEPGNSGYWTNLGVASSASGDDLGAFSAYKKATEVNPDEISAFLFMGQLLLERERYAEAREAWERVVKIDPDSEEAEEARENLRSIEQV